MITNYKETKDEVLRMYKEFLEIAEDADYPRQDKSMIALHNQVENIKKDKFLLMVAGEAKSGKSTFINAFLGQKILPMDVMQCTSAIVKIRYGSTFTLKATYAGCEPKTLTGEDDIKAFLIENAALNDKYRYLPIPTINNEVLIKYKGKFPKKIVDDLIEEVQSEKIYGLSPDECDKKIRAYIEENREKWRELVTEMEITYPFEDKSLQGIEIIDSPGVNAQGRVGDITNDYIGNANAIMFLKPITGAALESNSFKKFLESKSVERNGNALFMILTRAANETPENLERLQKEALRLYGKTIQADQIISVDSKVELFINHIINMTVEEIDAYLKELDAHQQLDAFIENLWYKSKTSKDKYLEMLRAKSNFSVVDQSLNRFGRKTHYLALSELLGRMVKVYQKISDDVEDQISLYQEKAQDPTELASKIADIKRRLNEINAMMSKTVDEVVTKYTGDSGIVRTKANAEVDEFRNSIENGRNADLDMLEKSSFRKIDSFVAFQHKLEKNIIAECNEALIALSNEQKIQYTALEPDFTQETFSAIKKQAERDATVPGWDEGVTFKKHHNSYVDKSKQYELIKKNIITRINLIKNDVINNLLKFADATAKTYIEELKSNAIVKKAELDRIMEEKKTAEEIHAIIANLRGILSKIAPMIKVAQEIKGGIDLNV